MLNLFRAALTREIETKIQNLDDVVKNTPLGMSFVVYITFIKLFLFSKLLQYKRCVEFSLNQNVKHGKKCNIMYFNNKHKDVSYMLVDN